MTKDKKLAEKLKTLPVAPGVYFHKNSDGEVIYVGKAAVLKKPSSFTKTVSSITSQSWPALTPLPR